MEDRACRNPTLAACLIVRDEAHSLGDCLQSLENQVDAIYVTDTGSTDSTVAIARSYGAIVRTVEWRDDFAAARNASIADVEEDWILVVDADDRFPQGEAARIRGQLSAEHCAATLLYSAVPGYTPIRAVRLFQNRLGAAFEGRIHENLDGWISQRRKDGVSLLHLGVNLLHTGYTAETMPRKLARNLPLLEEEWRSLATGPATVRQHFIAAELGTTLAKLRRHSEAAAFLQTCLDEITLSGAPMPLVSLQLVINLMWVLNDSGRVTEALQWIRKVESDFANEPGYVLHRGLQELAAGHHGTALIFLEAFRQSWDSDDFSIPVPTEYLGAAWWRAMGLCYMGQQHYKQAQDCFEICCDLEPANPEHQLRRLVAGRMMSA